MTTWILFGMLVLLVLLLRAPLLLPLGASDPTFELASRAAAKKFEEHGRFIRESFHWAEVNPNGNPFGPSTEEIRRDRPFKG